MELVTYSNTVSNVRAGLFTTTARADPVGDEGHQRPCAIIKSLPMPLWYAGVGYLDHLVQLGDEEMVLITLTDVADASRAMSVDMVESDSRIAAVPRISGRSRTEWNDSEEYIPRAGNS